MSKLLDRLRYNITLNKVARLEQRREFISPFFSGRTKYPIELAKWEKDYKKAQERLATLKANKDKS